MSPSQCEGPSLGQGPLERIQFSRYLRNYCVLSFVLDPGNTALTRQIEVPPSIENAVW